MTTAELIEYLEIVIEFERELYTQKRVEEGLIKSIEMCENLTWEKEELDKPFEEYYMVHESLEDFLEDMAPRKMLNKPVEPVMPNSLNRKKQEEDKTSEKSILKTILAGMSFRSKQNRENEKLIKEEYQQDCERYQRELKEYNEWYEKNQKKKKYRAQLYQKWENEQIKLKEQIGRRILTGQVCNVMLQELKKKEASTKDALEKAYGMNIIYPKYRNYVAVCSFYDYISSGICCRLDGSDGAYNKFDIESRMDKIITQLDTVIKNLELIRSNQYKLYAEMKNAESELKKIVNTTNQISNQMDEVIIGVGAIYVQNENQNRQLNAQIQQIRIQTKESIRNSELNAYFAECNQRELHYMNRMNYLAGHYDNPYGNYSPV